MTSVGNRRHRRPVEGWAVSGGHTSPVAGRVAPPGSMPRAPRWPSLQMRPLRPVLAPAQTQVSATRTEETHRPWASAGPWSCVVGLCSRAAADTSRARPQLGAMQGMQEGSTLSKVLQGSSGGGGLGGGAGPLGQGVGEAPPSRTTPQDARGPQQLPTLAARPSPVPPSPRMLATLLSSSTLVTASGITGPCRGSGMLEDSSEHLPKVMWITSLAEGQRQSLHPKALEVASP